MPRKRIKPYTLYLDYNFSGYGLGKNFKIGQNCLTCEFENSVMQMRKVRKGSCAGKER